MMRLNSAVGLPVKESWFSRGARTLSALRSRLGVFGVLAGLMAGLAFSPSAEAARFFVADTMSGPGVNRTQARHVSGIIRSTVQSSESDSVVTDPNDADYILQPRVMKTMAGLIITVEKKRGNEILHAAQSKVTSLAEFDRAARRAAVSAINEPANEPAPSVAARGPQAPRPAAPPRPPSESGATRPAPPAEGAPAVPYTPPTARGGQPPAAPEQAPPVQAMPTRAESELRSSAAMWPVKRKVGYWSVGLGPFIPRRMATNDVMYGAMVGHDWDINPRATIKALGEASFSSGNNQARFYNVGAGASFFLGPTIDTAPYVTADIGYGYAEDARGGTAEGFSWGTGVGIRFFRLTETTMDVLLRYAVVAESVSGGEGNPSILGLRVGVNF